MTPSSHKKTRQVSFANTTKLKPGAVREGNPPGSRHEAQQEKQELVSTPFQCTHCQKSGSRCVIQRGRRACNSCNARKVKCVQVEEAAEGKHPGEREPSSEVQSPESSPSPSEEPPQLELHDESPSPEQASPRGRKRQRSPDSYTEKPRLTQADRDRLLLEVREGAARIQKEVQQEFAVIEILFEELVELGKE
ncbi:hypothetical protein BS47DRAFT_1348149 [Hydnum rufescens UP504]|uniref:Zn(2)-C6 fungal-type domain-containing protein n=1 Tax=Hydnum rufescens UP504 TaxID=1448309 RepID=A0A9P6ARG1_9AGAM|nr:hypothetical protein BS47DRAFT_1348149 [Hydnum rufescens UP504]